jgi:arginase
MPDALVGAGMYEALGRHAVVKGARVTFEAPQPVRGPAGLLAEPALVSMVENLSDVTSRVLTEGSWPLVIGGDCSVLLGVLLGTRRPRGLVGLLFVDGHEDAWPPYASPTGEAADCELGLALGLHPPPEALHHHMPLIDEKHVVVLGPRDHIELSTASIASIRDRVRMIPGDELANGGVESIATDAVDRLRQRTRQWWLHVDLDVLSTEALPAVDYPQFGGLTWIQLHQLTAAALRQDGCIGASVVIYNPDLDGGSHAAVIIRYIEHLITTRQDDIA